MRASGAAAVACVLVTALGGALVLVAGAAGDTAIARSPGGQSMIEPALFERVPLGSMAPNPCSPKPPGPNWRGILIQAPTRVRLKPGERIGPRGAFAAVPICGYYLLDVLALAKSPPLTLVVTERASGKTWSGAVVEEDASPEEPPPPDTPTDPKLLAGVASGGYFNPNLVDYVRIPAAPAVYEVQAVWGDARSNVVTIELAR